MKIYNKKKPIISLHIPKCGGTSFQSVLGNWFGRKLYLHYYNEVESTKPYKHKVVKGIFKNRLENSICIHGHFNKARKFGVQDYYPEVDQFVTIIRDPLEVAISNYYYGKKLGENRFRDGRQLSMCDFFNNINEFLMKKKSFLFQHMPFDMNINNYEELINENFVYIGITEELQTSVDFLADRLGFPRVKVEHKNISQRDEEISEEAKREFIRNNQTEYMVYYYAKKHYMD